MNPEPRLVYIFASSWKRGGTRPSLVRAPARRSLNHAGAARGKKTQHNSLVFLMSRFIISMTCIEDLPEQEVDWCQGVKMFSDVSCFFLTFCATILNPNKRSRKEPQLTRLPTRTSAPYWTMLRCAYDRIIQSVNRRKNISIFVYMYISIMSCT